MFLVLSVFGKNFKGSFEKLQKPQFLKCSQRKWQALISFSSPDSYIHRKKNVEIYIHHPFHTSLRSWYSCWNFRSVFVEERNNIEIHYKGILLNFISSSWQGRIALFVSEAKESVWKQRTEWTLPMWTSPRNSKT